MKPAIGKYSFNLGYRRSSNPLSAPTLRCVYPVCFAAGLYERLMFSLVLKNLLEPMNCTS